MNFERFYTGLNQDHFQSEIIKTSASDITGFI